MKKQIRGNVSFHKFHNYCLNYKNGNQGDDRNTIHVYVDDKGKANT